MVTSHMVGLREPVELTSAGDDELLGTFMAEFLEANELTSLAMIQAQYRLRVPIGLIAIRLGNPSTGIMSRREAADAMDLATTLIWGDGAKDECTAKDDDWRARQMADA